MSHTPGPWTNENNLVRTDDACICQVFYCKFNGDHRDIDYIETESNARLIAAAPDLLEACKSALPLMKHYEGEFRTRDAMQHYCYTIELMESAIKKARGE